MHVLLPVEAIQAYVGTNSTRYLRNFFRKPKPFFCLKLLDRPFLWWVALGCIDADRRDQILVGKLLTIYKFHIRLVTLPFKIPDSAIMLRQILTK